MHNNDNNQRFDDMLYAYFGRGQESFEHRGPEHKRNYLRFSSAIAAVLVILLISSVVGYSLIKPQTGLTPHISAQDITFNNSYYKNVSEALGIIRCFADKEIVHIKVRSLTGNGSFFRLSGFPYEKGNPVISVYPEDATRHSLSEAFSFYSWTPEIDWTNRGIIAYHNWERTDDKIEIVVYLEDDTFFARYIDVTYDLSKPINEQLTMTLVPIS